MKTANEYTINSSRIVQKIMFFVNDCFVSEGREF